MRYDVYHLDGGLVLDVQSDLLDGLNTRVVVPLLAKASAPHPAVRLNPLFTLAEGEFVMLTQFMAAVPTNALGEPVANLMPDHDRIVAAIDMVFQGF